jgi:murein DD-endopeptidase MepM/ murein hydrolase activator NlpD
MSREQEAQLSRQTIEKGSRPATLEIGTRILGFGIRIIGILMLVGVGYALVWGFRSGLVPFPSAVPTSTETPIRAEDLVASGALPIDLDLLPEFMFESKASASQVRRDAILHTDFPSRPRIEVTHYEVQKGDTLFGISEKFSLKPETILWGNWYTMGGDPHSLRPGQELNILPVDGVLHLWTRGEGLNGVAKFYGVTAEDIINWPGNRLDPNIDRTNPDIEAGTALIVPNGRREPPSWQMVRITRSDPAVAKILGPGYCGSIGSGAIGDAVFGWPTASTAISGYHYVPGVHEAIDIGGNTGTAIFSADDGVVVYSGWNDWGYGLVVVVDHGNGWQTLYAHLSQINAGCGQSLSQGEILGLMGCTGNCTGSHLHFEMRNDIWGRVNPINFLP